MTGRRLLGPPKITEGWKLQFPVDVRNVINKRDKKRFKVGDRVAFLLQDDGTITVERGYGCRW